jgi:flagellar basal body-associated protein FliL
MKKQKAKKRVISKLDKNKSLKILIAILCLLLFLGIGLGIAYPLSSKKSNNPSPQSPTSINIVGANLLAPFLASHGGSIYYSAIEDDKYDVSSSAD